MKVNVPVPCLENWNEMDPTDGGRNCLKCSRKVHDFTHLQDEEIIEKVEKLRAKGERFCGRYRKSQLNRELKPSDTKTLPISKWTA